MKHFLILSLVVILAGCVNLGDRGSLSEEEIAAQEAARQEEAARAEIERRRAAMTDEERATAELMAE